MRANSYSITARTQIGRNRLACTNHSHLLAPTERFDQAIAVTAPEVPRGEIRALDRDLATFCVVDLRMMGMPERAPTVLD